MEIKQAEPILHDQQKTRCSKELVARWQNVIGLTPDATSHMEFTESAATAPSVSGTNEESGKLLRRESILDMDDQSDTSLPDEDDLPDFTELKRHVSIPNSRGPSSSGPSTSGEGAWNLIAPLRIVALHVQCSGGGRVLPESSTSPVKVVTSRGRGRGKGRGKAEPLVKPSTKGKTSGAVGGDVEANVADIEGLTSLIGGGSAIPSRDPVLVISHILCFGGPQDRTKQVVFTYGKSPHQGALPGVEVRKFDSESAMLTAWREYFFWEIDPDVLCVYQMKESLRYIAERFKVLKLGAFDIGRRNGQTSEVWSILISTEQVMDCVIIWVCADHMMDRELCAGEISCDLWKALGKAASSYDINFQSGSLSGLRGGKTGD